MEVKILQLKNFTPQELATQSLSIVANGVDVDYSAIFVLFVFLLLHWLLPACFITNSACQLVSDFLIRAVLFAV